MAVRRQLSSTQARSLVGPSRLTGAGRRGKRTGEQGRARRRRRATRARPFAFAPARLASTRFARSLPLRLDLACILAQRLDANTCCTQSTVVDRRLLACLLNSRPPAAGPLDRAQTLFCSAPPLTASLAREPNFASSDSLVRFREWCVVERAASRFPETAPSCSPLHPYCLLARSPARKTPSAPVLSAPKAGLASMLDGRVLIAPGSLLRESLAGTRCRRNPRLAHLGGARARSHHPPVCCEHTM